MAVIVEFGIPQEQLAFTELFEGHPDAVLEFEPTVSGGTPVDGTLVWISGVDTDDGTDVMESLGIVESIRPLLERDGAYLCELVAETRYQRVWTALAENTAYLLAATGSRDGWRFHVLFPDRGNISPFIQDIQDLGLDICTRHVDTSPFPRDEETPSEFQSRALEIALEKGYWEVPREASLQTIAEELGISDQAASERIRRGIKTLVDEEVGETE